MNNTFKVLEVTCPICGLAKTINIPEAIFLQKKFGIIKIQVPINAICPKHQFLVFVDTKGIVKGYEKIDLHMAPISPKAEKATEGKINLRNLIQTFGTYGVFSLIHAKIFNYSAYIIKDDDFEYSEEILNRIGDSILPEVYRGNKTIYLLDDPEIRKIKVKDKDSLIMDTHQHIFQTPWKENLKFEEGILKRALEIINEQEQQKLLQQDISKFINDVNYAVSILETVEDIYEGDLIEKLSKALKIKKVSSYYLNLIKEFITRNISKKIVSKIKTRVGEFLSLI